MYKKRVTAYTGKLYARRCETKKNAPPVIVDTEHVTGTLPKIKNNNVWLETRSTVY